MIYYKVSHFLELVPTSTSNLSTENFANRQFHESILLVCGDRQFRKPVLSAKVSRFKILTNLLLKLHVLVFFVL